MGEAEDPGGDAAEGKALHAVRLRQGQAGAVAGGQKPLMLRRQGTLHDGPHGVEDIPGGEIIGRGEFGPPGRLLMPLFRHEPCAGVPEL